MNIVIVSPGMEHNGETLKTKSLGGSETAAIQLAEAFAALKGHTVHVFSPCADQSKTNGVVYNPIDAAQEYIVGADIDVLIVSRVPQILHARHNAKVCYLWQHDLGLKRQAPEILPAMYQIDRILVMSEFQKNQYKEVYGLPEDAFKVIRNGIDLGLFPAPRGLSQKEWGLMVYAARPERGLENLVKSGGIMERLANDKVPVRLMVAGYDNTTAEMRPYYEALWQRCEVLPNVQRVGHLTKKELYDLYSRAWMYVYPTPSAIIPDFDEISCITAMEAAACCLPFMTTKRGALSETVVPGSAVWIPGNGHEQRCQDSFVQEIKNLAQPTDRNKARIQSMIMASYKGAINFEWKPVAETLVAEAEEIMSARCSDPVRMFHHFYRLSDMEMCDRLTREHSGDARFMRMTARERGIISVRCAFKDDAEAFQAHYDHIGANANPAWELGGEPRTQQVVEIFKRNWGKEPYRTVLDFGCAVGNQAIRISNACPNLKILGVDINADVIRKAEGLTQTNAEHPGNLLWAVGKEDSDPLEIWREKTGEVIEGFDIVHAGEVLEHVQDPALLIKRLEAWCRPGGVVFLTVPYGPWDELHHDRYGHSDWCHIRHYDMADLIDVFGKKKDFNLFYKCLQFLSSGEPCGHHYISYVCDHMSPTGEVDLTRKISRQAPRETVSACIIAYNAEAMLHRTLKSIRNVSTEIIVAVDPKTTDSTRAIAAQYGALVIDGLNPMDVGFDEARNHSIRDAEGDFILWIDSDEELLNPGKLSKYLRPNAFKGYALQQHHLSVDPPMNMKPDLPVRLFRNREGIRFFGVCHEHPEKAVNEGVGYGTVLTDTWIAHDGYLTEDVRRMRFLRNIGLVLRDRKKYPDRKLTTFLYLRDLIHMIRYRGEMMNGGRQPAPGTAVPIDPQATMWALEAVELWEKHFMDNPGDPMTPDAIAYYSDANRVLGRGVPIRVRFEVPGSPNAKEVVAQFSDSTKAATFLGGVAKTILSQYEGKYV